MPFQWWMHNIYTQMFMIRELTSIFAALYVAYLMALIGLAGSGNMDAFRGCLYHPASYILQLIALAFVIFHSITWFNLAPKAMTVWRGEEKVSPVLVAGANYVLWLGMTALVLLVIFPHQ
jgi:fumarate reductase subunit C